MTAPAVPEQRHQALVRWLESLTDQPAMDLASLVPASSDASFRRYFRVKSGKGTLIVMDAPPPHENCVPFVDVTARLQNAGVTVPTILAHDISQGFMLLTDLGHQTYYDRIQAGLPDVVLQGLYRDALDMLVKMQTASQAGLAAFDQERLAAELQLFPQWYVAQHCQAELTEKEQALLLDVFGQLAGQMASEPRVLVHRDFHSPNLMACDVASGLANPGVLDYQDAVSGAISYDMASLVFDARTTWEESQQLDWAIRYWEKARAKNLPVPEDFAVFHQQYEWSGLQRNLRILGVFARLHHRDGKPQYLAHIPRVLGYVRQVAGRYRAFTGLMRLLDRLDGIQTQVKLTF